MGYGVIGSTTDSGSVSLEEHRAQHGQRRDDPAGADEQRGGAADGCGPGGDGGLPVVVAAVPPVAVHGGLVVAHRRHDGDAVGGRVGAGALEVGGAVAVEPGRAAGRHPIGDRVRVLPGQRAGVGGERGTAARRHRAEPARAGAGNRIGRPERDDGALRDGVLRVRVDLHGTTEPGGDELGDQRDPRGPAHEQHDRRPGRGQPGRGDRPLQRLDRLLQPGPDALLEVAAVQAHRRADLAEPHRDRDLRVGRQALLGLAAVAAQPGHRGQDVRVGLVEPLEGGRDGVAHVVDDGLVEVGATELLDALGPAEQREPAARGLLAHDGGVEGPAAQVVDGDGRAGLDPLVGRVVQRGGLRLGEERDGQPALGEGRGEQVALVRAPGRRVGHRDALGRAALGARDDVDDVLGQQRGQLLGGEGPLAERDRRGVADAPLELAGDAVRFGQRAALGGLAEQQTAVGRHVDHGRDVDRVITECDHLDGAGSDDRSRGAGGADVDAQQVTHRLPGRDRSGEPVLQRVGRGEQVGGPADPWTAPDPVHRPGHRDGGDDLARRVAHRRRHRRHPGLTFGDALCPAAAADVDEHALGEARVGEDEPLRGRVAPGGEHLRPGARGHRQPGPDGHGVAQAGRRLGVRDADPVDPVAAVELDALAGDVAQPGEHGGGGVEQRVRPPARELAEGRARVPAPVRCAQQHPVRLEPDGEPVGRGPRQAGALTELRQAARPLRRRPENPHGLVEHADPARLSHVPILTSHDLGSPPRSDHRGGGRDHRREAAHAGREGLGPAPRPQGRGRRARPALHRPAPGARGHEPAGVRRAPARRPPGAPSGPHHRHRGPQRPDPRRPRADRGRGLADPGGDPAPQLRGVRRPPAPDERPRAGDRARGRPAAGADPAGHHGRLRRLPHLHPRRVRRDGLRHRHLRGRARARHADAAAQAVPDDGDRGVQRRRHAAPGRHQQGRHPRRHRADRHRRRAGPRARVPGQRHREPLDGGPDDDLQHVDRGRRPRGHDRPGRDDLRLPEGPRPRPGRRRLGRRRRRLAVPAHRRRRRVRRGRAHRRRRAHPVRHLGHQPRSGPAAGRVRARPGRHLRRRRARRRGEGAVLHGPHRRHAAARGPRRRGVRRLLHQRPDRGPALGRGDPRRPSGREGRADAGRPRVDAGPLPGRGGGPGQGLHRRGRRVALRGLLDVPGHEPRPARARRALRVHLEPQLRGPAGQGRPHPPGVAAGRRRDRRARHAEQPGGPGLMEKFDTHTGIGVPLRRSNVDTDQIIPAVYLKRVTRTGFEDGLFSAWRDDPSFVLNNEPFDRGSVLVAGPDFGTGSSREHAVWALMDYGFRVVISSRFADIFRGNSSKGGLVAAEVAQPDVELMWKKLETEPGTEITVDLGEKTVQAGDLTVPFEIDDYARWRLREGLDDIGLTLRHEGDITAFEGTRPARMPRTLA
ncbi:hypothetical protein L7F22_049423 [Adiantum nelumboides]|nr:hypothetical protein [Adiantum nelumboides]